MTTTSSISHQATTRMYIVHHRYKKSNKMVIDSVIFKNFEVFIWLGHITMVIVYNVTIEILYAYHFQCVDLFLLILKFTLFLQILIPTSY